MFKKSMLLISIILISCNQSVPMSGIAMKNCISPIVDFAYPLQKADKAIKFDNVLPPTTWEMVKNLSSLNNRFLNFYLELARTKNGNDEIWIKASENNHNFTDLLVYQVQSKTWNSFSLDVVPYNLFLDNKGEVWGAYNNQQDYPLFGKYNDNKEFEYVFDNQGLLFDNTDYKFLFVDTDGFFWVTSRDAIYTFNPRTNDLEPKILLNNEEVLDGTQMPDDVIYFQIGFKRELIKYNPTTGEVIRLQIPLENLIETITFELPGESYLVTDIFGDSKNRLWIHNYGWMDSDETWYQVFDTSIFISEGIHDRYRYNESLPNIIFESSDRLLWFSSDSGTTTLNTTTKEWCWLTTFRSNVVEDSKGNVWMIADNKLYKHSLKP